MTISNMKDLLLNHELFGNEAGDDEDLEVLDSYFLHKLEFENFYSDRRKLGFVRSRKGMGKSALLRQAMYRRSRAHPEEIHMYVKASDLVAIQDTKSSLSADLIYAWQQRICTRINLEIGSTLRLGISDDSIMLIESAEVAGFRNRNIVSALVDRIKIKSDAVEFNRERLVSSDSQAVLERVLDKKDVSVWLYIDDIDATFLNTEHERIVISTFFSACRNLVSNVDGLMLRASVRTDVWSLLAQHDEALDKCEQYMLDLTWSTKETGQIIENKIASFFRRLYPSELPSTDLSNVEYGNYLRNIIFREPYLWSGRKLESFRPIHILSAGRPRWAAQLCKMAAKHSHEKRSKKISMGHIREALEKYGRLRVADIYKEHRHQCPKIEDIIESFSGGQRRYTTEELLRHITDKVIRHRGMPVIDGVSAASGGLSIASFLFRVGFIAARDDSAPSGLGFIAFDDRPNLLSTTSNLDDGLDWEIHPSYRNVLRVRSREVTDLFDVDAEE